MAVLITVLTIVFLRRRAKKKHGKLINDRIGVNAHAAGWLNMGFAILLVFLGLSFLNTPWMPTETLELADGSVVVGHVVGEDTDRTLILDKDRAAVWITTTYIKGRRIRVIPAGSLWTTTYGDFRAARRYDSCPAA